MKEHIDGGAKVVFGVRRKSECVCGVERKVGYRMNVRFNHVIFNGSDA